MTNETAMTLSPARLEELIEIADDYTMRYGNENDRDILTALRDYARVRAVDWVPWKPGDALPAPAAYRCVFQSPSGDYDYRWLRPEQFDSWEITAYWPIALPPPYVPPQDQPQDGGRET